MSEGTGHGSPSTMHQSLSAAIFVLVLPIAWFGFTQIEVTDGHRWHVAEAFYQAISLFVFHPKGMPEHGPAGWLAVMWACYFLAPAATIGLVVNHVRTIYAAFYTPDRAVANLEGNHVVVCGVGKHARMVIHEILKQSKGMQRIVVVEQNASTPPFLDFAVEQAGTRPLRVRIPVIVGSMADEATLARARVADARKVLAFSGDEIVNLNTCLAVIQLGPRKANRVTVALVTDLGLSAGILEFAKQEGVNLFNPYEIAASNLVQMLQGERSPLVTSSGRLEIAIAGFGRFGQSFANAVIHLQKSEGKSVLIHVIDRAAEKLTAKFQCTFREDTAAFVAHEGDFDDPRLFEEALGVDAQLRRPIILCADDDAKNLNTALLLHNRWNFTSVVVLRLFDQPPGFAGLSDGSGIRPEVMSTLLLKNLPPWMSA